MDRRTFLKGVALAAAAAAVPGVARGAGDAASLYRTTLHKALIRKRMDADTAKELLAAGFRGVELQDKSVTPDEARAGLKVAQENGLKIHSFMGGWAEFNSKDAAKRKAAIEATRRNIEITEAYGAGVMLLVPGRIGGVAMPNPSQFDLEFDPRTLELKRAAAEGGFAAYVAAQNDATKHAQDALAELAPFAAERGVVLALENVWNNLWVKPDFMAAFVRSFANPWVKAYLDLGNHVRYAPVEKWLSALSDQIVKLHIKDFKIDRSARNEGQFVRLGEGSINWKRVRRAIDAVGYSGWVSIEENGWTDAEYAGIMDRFFNGTF